MRYELLGGEHYGYERVFNNLSWKKGGRLYSSGEDCYQCWSEAERLKMTINGEPVAEIDIKASFLTIYHAMARQPLQGSGDPYAAIAEIDRSIVKLWTTISFGNSNPATRWPPKTAKNFKKETGKDLSKVAKAKDIAQKDAGELPGPEEAGDAFRSLGSPSVSRRSGGDGNDDDTDARASRSQPVDVRWDYCTKVEGGHGKGNSEAGVQGGCWGRTDLDGGDCSGANASCYRLVITSDGLPKAMGDLKF